MIVDSSAIVAIIKGEEDAGRFASALTRVDDAPRISAANWLEAAMVIDRHGDGQAIVRFDALFGPTGIAIIPVSVVHASRAREAWRVYGKGSGHPAQLNYGDCFAYATAREEHEALLFKGHDFPHTDVKPVLKD